MDSWNRVVALSLGGVLGVNARYWLGVAMNRWAAAHWATFTINISGSFAIGILSIILVQWLPHPNFRLMILTGFLGGYTTFSTLALESAHFWERGEKPMALGYLGGSLVLGLIAALLGMSLARDFLVPTWERAWILEKQAKAQAAGVPRPRRDGRLAEADAGSPDLELPPEFDATGDSESEPDDFAQSRDLTGGSA